MQRVELTREMSSGLDARRLADTLHCGGERSILPYLAPSPHRKSIAGFCPVSCDYDGRGLAFWSERAASDTVQPLPSFKENLRHHPLVFVIEQMTVKHRHALNHGVCEVHDDVH